MTLRFGSFDLPLRMLIPCVVSLALFGALQLFLSRTFIGRAIMAVSQDQLALRLMAVDPVKIKRIAFGLSIATAALAGALPDHHPARSSARSGREYHWARLRHRACWAVSAACPAR